MKEKKKAAAGLALVIVATILMSFSVAKGQSSIKDYDDIEEAWFTTIVGVWKTTVVPRDCETGEQIMPPFEGILTFNYGGTMAETSSGSAPGTRGPGHGVWRRTRGHRTYSISFLFQRFSPGGLIGTTEVQQEVEIDGSGDTFTSTGTVEIIANDGSVLASFCSTSTGAQFR